MKIFKSIINNVLSRLDRFEIRMFLGWFLAAHIFQILVFPSLMIPTQILSNFTLKERMIQIWVSSADALHYMEVAKHGYTNESYVFFPLWPLMMKLLFANALLSKILASFLSLVFLILVTKLSQLWNFKDVSSEIIMSLVAFPFSIMLLMPMSEPLYLVLTALAMINTEKKRYIKAAFFVALATATRMIGVVLIIYLFFKLLTERKAHISQKLVALIISPLGVILYSFYLQLTKGDFLLFYKQETNWDRSLGIKSLQKLFQESADILGQIFGSYKPVPINLLHFGAVILFILLTIYAYKKLSFTIWIYSVMAIVIPLISGTFLGVPRYLLAAFPLYMVMGNFLHKHKVLYYLYVALGFMLQSYLLIRLFNFEMVA